MIICRASNHACHITERHNSVKLCHILLIPMLIHVQSDHNIHYDSITVKISTRKIACN